MARSSTTARIHRTTRYALVIEFIRNRRGFFLIVCDTRQLSHIRHPPVDVTSVVVRVQAGNKCKRVVPDERAVHTEVARIASAVPVVVVLLHPLQLGVVISNG